MLAVLGPEVGAGPSCRAIVIQDNVRLAQLAPRSWPWSRWGSGGVG